MQILINKKYSLPYLVIDKLAAHFARFASDAGPLPLVWHQSLLAMAQRYHGDLTREQKDAIKAVLHVHSHHGITPEIRRELFTGGCRGDAPAAALAAGAADAAAGATPAVSGFAAAFGGSASGSGSGSGPARPFAALPAPIVAAAAAGGAPSSSSGAAGKKAKAKGGMDIEY